MVTNESCTLVGKSKKQKQQDHDDVDGSDNFKRLIGIFLPSSNIRKRQGQLEIIYRQHFLWRWGKIMMINGGKKHFQQQSKGKKIRKIFQHQKNINR